MTIELLLLFELQLLKLFQIVHQVNLASHSLEALHGLPIQVLRQGLAYSLALALLPGGPRHLLQQLLVDVNSGAHHFTSSILCITIIHHLAASTIARKRSNIYSLSLGPGEASEWYWMEKRGSSLWRIPSTVPSLRLTWVTSSSGGR